jgi:hypothetical protein
MIEYIHGLFNLTLGDSRQVPVFREVLPYESIGILIHATFPGGIRMYLTCQYRLAPRIEARMPGCPEPPGASGRIRV